MWRWNFSSTLKGEYENSPYLSFWGSIATEESIGSSLAKGGVRMTEGEPKRVNLKIHPYNAHYEVRM